MCNNYRIVSHFSVIFQHFNHISTISIRREYNYYSQYKILQIKKYIPYIALIVVSLSVENRRMFSPTIDSLRRLSWFHTNVVQGRINEWAKEGK